MVRLKDGYDILDCQELHNFNSSMVRLKEETFIVSLIDLYSFQFLNGAIKSFVVFVIVHGKSDFNSSMVRLKVIK